MVSAYLAVARRVCLFLLPNPLHLPRHSKSNGASPLVLPPRLWCAPPPPPSNGAVVVLTTFFLRISLSLSRGFLSLSRLSRPSLGSSTLVDLAEPLQVPLRAQRRVPGRQASSGPVRPQHQPVLRFQGGQTGDTKKKCHWFDSIRSHASLLRRRGETRSGPALLAFVCG